MRAEHSTGARAAKADPPVYDSALLAPPVLHELQQTWSYRDLVTEFVLRDIKSRYKRSSLGIAWTMLNPLLMMAVLTFVFSNVFRFELAHYPVYVLSAQVVWTFFTQTTTSAMNQLAWGGPLITKIYIPKAVFPVSAVGTGLVNLLLALVPVALLLFLSGVPLTPALLWLPVTIGLAACFTLGVSLLLSAVSVSFHDIVDMWQVGVTALFFFTPIMYPRSILPTEYVWLLNLNPLYHIIEAFRLPIYSGWPAGPYTMFAAATSSVVTFVVGWVVFASRAGRMAAQA